MEAGLRTPCAEEVLATEEVIRCSLPCGLRTTPTAAGEGLPHSPGWRIGAAESILCRPSERQVGHTPAFSLHLCHHNLSPALRDRGPHVLRSAPTLPLLRG